MLPLFAHSVTIAVVSLGCYKCSSINGSDLDCEDEFVAKPEYYTSNCMAARKSYTGANQHVTNVRVGLYPARWCIKFTATDSEFIFCLFQLYKTCSLVVFSINLYGSKWLDRATEARISHSSKLVI